MAAPLHGVVAPLFRAIHASYRTMLKRNRMMSYVGITIGSAIAYEKACNEFTVPNDLKWMYQTFQKDNAHTSHPKPLSGKFSAKFTGTYPENSEITTANHDVVTLGFSTSQRNKKYENFTKTPTQITHTVHLAGHIQCTAGDNACNNALYTLSTTRDFSQCMHAALSHPEIPRTQRCQSLFAALGNYGPGDQALDKPLCKYAGWKFSVKLDAE